MRTRSGNQGGGIVTPYESQAGITVGNAGRAAPSWDTSAFMTPGQRALPHGLDQLAKGADKLGQAIFRLGYDRQVMQNTTDLLADQVAETDEYRTWWNNYQEKNKGASAREAATATDTYSAKHVCLIWPGTYRSGQI